MRVIFSEFQRVRSTAERVDAGAILLDNCLWLANSYFAHDPSGFTSCYHSAMRPVKSKITEQE